MDGLLSTRPTSSIFIKNNFFSLWRSKIQFIISRTDWNRKYFGCEPNEVNDFKQFLNCRCTSRWFFVYLRIPPLTATSTDETYCPLTAFSLSFILGCFWPTTRGRRSLRLARSSLLASAQGPGTMARKSPIIICDANPITLVVWGP